tara:strand:- start:463 stop:687 length:225 start_codon:yes stop_codon:yes gene_type:complete
MFAELTEIVVRDKISSHLSKPKERTISINPAKIQSFYEDEAGRTILELRRESIKIKQSYEEVQYAIQATAKSNS